MAHQLRAEGESVAFLGLLDASATRSRWRFLRLRARHLGADLYRIASDRPGLERPLDLALYYGRRIGELARMRRAQVLASVWRALGGAGRRRERRPAVPARGPAVHL